MIKKVIALVLIVFAVYWSFSSLMPSEVTSVDVADTQFSTHRALIHLKEISRVPHYLGNEEHNKVRDYVEKELQKLGLETQIQEGFSVDDSGNLAKAKNIIGRIRGSGDGSKALVLLTHYDSDPHSAIGASDAGSGVVTILEGLRAFLSAGKTPENDIVVLISDAEELGLNGARLFVKEHVWAKDVGLVLNFEARGSGGPSIMFMETNQGNANLIKGFVEANPAYPVSNSLFYSIYKIMPNDTDLTVFREEGDIDGFNFAFIDDHFDYHTQLDNYNRLDRETLEHQGQYLMPLLHYFSGTDLDNVKDHEDYVYFNLPLFKMVTYPFSGIYPMLVIAILAFVMLLRYGFKQKRLTGKTILKGALAFMGALVLAVLLGCYGWPILKAIYPNYGEMLHGFTYNGHAYIAAFAFLTLAICWLVYYKTYAKGNTASLLVAPIAVWLLVCVGVAVKLKGASFFIIPVYFALLSLFVSIRQKHPNLITTTLLCFPVLTMITPFVRLFPIGLGLKMLVSNTVFVVLIFGFLIPVFGVFKHKKRWGYLFVVLAIYFFISAHMQSGFSHDRPKPNSLVYVLNADDNTAVWATYDKLLDDWTEPFFGNEPKNAGTLNNNIIDSKYGTAFSFISEAPLKPINPPVVQIINDTIIEDLHHIAITIVPQRHINRIELFSEDTNTFHQFIANGVRINRTNSVKGDRLLSYFVTDKEALNLELIVPKNQKTICSVLEASYNLLEDEHFNIPKRTEAMIPKPFVLNDAIVVKKTVALSSSNNN